MPVYPASPPVINGDVMTIHTLMQTPAVLAQRIADLTMNRFLADYLLTGRYPISGGSLQYQQEREGNFTDRDVRAVTPGGEYPLANFGVGSDQIAEVVKWGQDTYVTDEAIKRLLMDPVNRALVKLSNSVVKKVDAVALAVIASQITRTIAAESSWIGNTPKILRDVLKAKATVLDLDIGVNPNTLVVGDMLYAYIASDPTLASLAARENGASPVYTGAFPVIGDVTVVPASTARLPFTGEALLIDRDQLGGTADEQLGGPGYVTAPNQPNIEVKVIRDDDNDQYRPRARRVTVPVVVEPNAAIRITGVQV